jgi:hypothetical protein
VCPNHDAPFDFVYSAFMSQYKTIIAMANRSGGKTLDLAILGLLDTLANDNCESANLGAIQAQALRCASYMKKFVNENADFVARLKGEMTATKINWFNGSLNEILVATMTGVNSPHPQKLKMDEVELIPWPILQEAFSMVQSKEGVEGITVLGSTRKFAAGPMQRLVEDAGKSATVKLFSWCIWEVVEALPIDPKEVARIKEIFGDYLPEHVDHCSGYYQWGDLIDKFTRLDRDVWETQWECKRPDTQGLVYPRFDEVLNGAPDFKLDFEALRNGWAQVYIFEDFGYSKEHPDVILFAWVNFQKQEVTIFDEMYSWHKGTDEILADFADKLKANNLTKQDTSGWIGDPHAITDQVDRYNKGWPMMGNHFVTRPEDKLPGELYNVKNGISHVRKFIDDRRLKITKNIVEYRRELLSYAKKKLLNGTFSDEPEKDNDHGNDAARYGLIWLFPQQAYGSYNAEDFKTSEYQDPKDMPYTAGLASKTF